MRWGTWFNGGERKGDFGAGERGEEKKKRNFADGVELS